MLAASVGARCQLVYLDVTSDEQRRRARTRPLTDSATSFEMTDEELESWRVGFQVPDASELEGSHLDAPPEGFESWETWTAQWWPSSLQPE